jgi:hypothetical protein
MMSNEAIVTGYEPEDHDAILRMEAEGGPARPEPDAQPAEDSLEEQLTRQMVYENYTTFKQLVAAGNRVNKLMDENKLSQSAASLFQAALYSLSLALDAVQNELDIPEGEEQFMDRFAFGDVSLLEMGSLF